MRTFLSLRILLAAALPLAAGCSPTDADFRGRPLPAAIDMGTPAAQVVVPAEVRAHEPFTVQVTTYGGGCTRQGYTETASGESHVDVHPYDYFPSDENAACTRDLRTYQHEATVRMEVPGTGTVRVHGRRMPGGEPVVVTRTVTVTG